MKHLYHANSSHSTTHRPVDWYQILCIALATFIFAYAISKKNDAENTFAIACCSVQNTSVLPAYDTELPAEAFGKAILYNKLSSFKESQAQTNFGENEQHSGSDRNSTSTVAESDVKIRSTTNTRSVAYSDPTFFVELRKKCPICELVSYEMSLSEGLVLGPSAFTTILSRGEYYFILGMASESMEFAAGILFQQKNVLGRPMTLIELEQFLSSAAFSQAVEAAKSDAGYFEFYREKFNGSVGRSNRSQEYLTIGNEIVSTLLQASGS